MHKNPLLDELDPQTDAYLAKMAESEKLKANRIPGVRTVLVILSSSGMVYDMESLRQKVILAYPDSAVFFQTTRGKPIGASAPQHIDLVIDFTGPGQRQGLFVAKKLRRTGRVVVGRNAGLFRKRIYDRCFDEKVNSDSLPKEILEKERYIQRQVLALAGVAFVQAGDTPPDRGKTIALELPPLRQI